MGIHVIKLPDVGEGVAEAELVEWAVEEGQNVLEDQVLASVMTDKATVEIPSPVIGKVIWRGAKVGEVVAVGSPIIRLEVDGAGNEKPVAEPPAPPVAPPGGPAAASAPAAEPSAPAAPKASGDKGASKPGTAKAPAPTQRAAGGPVRPEGEKPLASPAVRKRALDAGVDLRRVAGSGPAARITHDDLDAYFRSGPATVARGRARDTSVTEIPVIGLRRKIAEKMTLSRSRIADIVYVEEIDMTAVEELRAKLNAATTPGRPRLTLLPFLMCAMVRTIKEHPQINAHFDDEAGLVRQFGGIHVGVAAQTDGGLVVPVVRHAEARSLFDCAAEIARLADAAKAGQCTREELTGSTITITSLGALGGIVTTPVINHPEVAIVGVNKMQTLPRWNGERFEPRKVMNLSCAFDHRIIDGWNAAVFVQGVKALLESPALIFIEE